MRFTSSNPLDIVGNHVSGYANAGILCMSASPSFVESYNGGRNCITQNQIGFHAKDFSFPVLGTESEPGINSIAGNSSYQVKLENYCDVTAIENFWREPEPIPWLDFSIDGTSSLNYEPFLSTDPISCTQGQAPIAGSPGSESKASREPEGTQGIFDNSLARQALQLRLQRHHAQAITLLKTLIAAHRSEVRLVVWALQELIANYEFVRNPNGADRLSVYLRTLLGSENRNFIRRIIRDVLSTSLLHERDITGTLIALDEIIQQHPNTSSELLALYSKVTLALHTLNDVELAQSTLQELQARYPTDELTSFAEVLVDYFTSNSSGTRPTLLSQVAEVKPAVPIGINLEQNYPNPFNPTTKIRYALPADVYVVLKVYNTLGQEVAALVQAEQKAGRYEATFDASNLSSGIYIYRLHANKFVQAKKMLLLR